MGLRGPLSSKGLAESVPPGLGKPVAPTWLTETQRAMFNELAGEVVWLTSLDRNALTRYCLLHSAWREAQGPHGDAKEQARMHRRGLRLAGELRALETALGLTPAARARLGYAPCKPVTEGPALKARFFNRVK